MNLGDDQTLWSFIILEFQVTFDNKNFIVILLGRQKVKKTTFLKKHKYMENWSLLKD